MIREPSHWVHFEAREEKREGHEEGQPAAMATQQSYEISVDFTQQFRDEYLRNNKAHGSKNLRCFPCCSEKNHTQKGFCGQAVMARMIVDSAAGERIDPNLQETLFIVGEIQPLDEDFHPISHGAHESAILLNSVSSQPKYILAKKEFLSCTTSQLVLNLSFESRPWYYSWIGSRQKQHTLHAFTISVMRGGNGGGKAPSEAGGPILDLLAQIKSPPFRISCVRRAGGKESIAASSLDHIPIPSLSNQDLNANCPQRQSVGDALAWIRLQQDCSDSEESGRQSITEKAGRPRKPMATIARTNCQSSLQLTSSHTKPPKRKSKPSCDGEVSATVAASISTTKEIVNNSLEASTSSEGDECSSALDEEIQLPSMKNKRYRLDSALDLDSHREEESAIALGGTDADLLFNDEASCHAAYLLSSLHNYSREGGSHLSFLPFLKADERKEKVVSLVTRDASHSSCGDCELQSLLFSRVFPDGQAY